MKQRSQRLFVLVAALLALGLGLPSSAQADRFDRSGTWSGELGVGVMVLDNESGFSVGGQARYHFTRHVALGPAVEVGIADTSRVYNLRMLLRIGTVLGEKSSSPFEVYAEAGAGGIIFDYDATPGFPPTIPAMPADTQADLVVPFGGGFIWHIGGGVGIQGGALMNVTTNKREKFFPEFFAGLIF